MRSIKLTICQFLVQYKHFVLHRVRIVSLRQLSLLFITSNLQNCRLRFAMVDYISTCWDLLWILVSSSYSCHGWSKAFQILCADCFTDKY